jgi:hypothetical protein
MAAPLGFDNAIAWAQFQLRGGLRNVLSTTGIYGLCVLVALFGWMRLMPDNPAAVYSGATTFLLIGQLIVLVFIGSNALTTAVRNDVSTRMIDSHRLMPTPPGWAILGYMFGATIQACGLAAVNFVVGVSTTVGAGMPLQRWLVPHVILAFFVFLAWSVMLLAGFFAKSGFGWIVMIGIFSSMGQGIAVAVLPGLMLLLSPLIGSTIFSMRTAQTEISREYGMAFLAQAFVGSIFLYGATRKYRRSENRALGVVPAMVLLAGWIVMSMVGIAYWDDLRPQFGPFNNIQLPQFIGSLCSCALLALLPVGNAAQASLEWDHHRRIDDPALGRRPIPPLAVAVVGGVLTLALCVVAPMDRRPVHTQVLLTAAVILPFLASMRYLLELAYRLNLPGRVVGGTYTVLLWLVPLGVDFMRSGLADSPDEEPLQAIATIRPIGAMIQIWGRGTTDPKVGIAVQAALAVGFAVLFYAWIARGQRRRREGT